MKYIFSNNRTRLQQSIYDSAIKKNWTVKGIFSSALACEYRTEKEREVWFPVLTSLAFAEASAMYGFGERISVADDLSTKSWLVTHLLDETKHTEGFSNLLRYLYPSKLDSLQINMNRYIRLYYGKTHKCESILEWLICTQIVEVFGKNCYKAILPLVNDDRISGEFFKKVISDETSHITYVSSLINDHRNNLCEQKWRSISDEMFEKMIPLAASIFMSPSGLLRNFEKMGIDVEKFCAQAVSDLSSELST
jgi:ribonucleotide reductase beta subunit family protein with ferritin-like domain